MTRLSIPSYKVVVNKTPVSCGEHAILFFVPSNILPLPMLFYKLSSILMYNICNKLVPSSISEPFSLTQYIQNYYTRSSSSGQTAVAQIFIRIPFSLLEQNVSRKNWENSQSTTSYKRYINYNCKFYKKYIIIFTRIR